MLLLIFISQKPKLTQLHGRFIHISIVDRQCCQPTFGNLVILKTVQGMLAGRVASSRCSEREHTANSAQKCLHAKCLPNDWHL